MLIKLMLGIRHFKGKPFKKMQHMFEQLSEGQNPDILFITCSDSRVIPSLLTHSKPGDLFVIRNVGNIIPPSSVQSSEAAAIEYALKVLNIKNIIICGHSNCGAMKGLLTPMPGNQLPAVSSWLTHSQAVLKEMHKKKTDQTDNPSLKLQRAIQQNILTQMDHLRTYPVIAEKLARQELTLHGWFYEFESGEVFIYEEHRDDFINLESAVDDAIEERRNKIVQEIVMNYLEPFSHPHTAKDYHALMHIFSHLSMDLTAIWPMIRTPVLKTLWRELGGLYTGPTDKKFLAMAELGRTTHMTHLKDFQKNIQESSGYHQACSQIIRQSGFLSPQIPLTIPRVIIEIEAFSSRI